MVLLSLVLLLVSTESAPPIPDRWVPDTELAGYPVIVVARWRGAPFERNARFGNGPGQWWWGSTRISVERVIRGDLAPGDLKIRLHYAAGWDRKGGRVESFASTWQDGDVEEVRDRNLWFLRPKENHDSPDDADFVCLDSFRGVQPLVLEPYFAALSSRDPMRRVPPLVESRDPVLACRALEFVSGGQLPWPYEPWDFVRPRRHKRAPLTQEASRVLRLLHTGKLPQVRRVAAAVYAELAGDRSAGEMRRLLCDADPAVRAIAAGILTALRDSASLDRMAGAVRGVHDGSLACGVIERLARWGHDGTVNALIEFLENDDDAGYPDGLPALRAREGLWRITGCEFPLDVAASREAWKAVRGIPDRAIRRDVLQGLLGRHMVRITARARNADGSLDVVLTNHSARPVYVLRRPSWIDLASRSGSSWSASGEPTGSASFARLGPGESLRFRPEIDDDVWSRFLASPPTSRSMTVAFLSNGAEFGLNAWMGQLDVAFAEGWVEPKREVRRVVERWSNGKTKAEGITVNGKREGVWTFYREDGKRIREVRYFYGDVGAGTEFNPDYAGDK